MRVLYISYDGMTDPLGQSQVIPYLRQLSRYNIEIHILSTEKAESFAENKKHISEILDNTGIKWHFIKYTKNPPVLSTVKDISRLNKKASELHKKYGFDLCHCRSYISAFAGLNLKNKFNLPFLFDMRGFYADERVDGGLWNLKNPVFKQVFKFFKRKEKKFLEKSDHIISLTETGKELICEFDNIKTNEDDITVIPCCADLSHFDPGKSDKKLKFKLKKETGIKEDDFVLSYLGSLGTWYMTDEMLDFYAELLKSKPNAKFLIISRDNPDIILKPAKEKNIPLDNIIIRPADRNEVPLMISLSSVSLFFIKPVFSKKASSPTKLAEILGMGIPVICNSNVGDIDRIVEKNNAGIAIKEMNSESYQRAVSKIAELQKFDPERLRRVSEKLFSLDKGSKSYFDVYKKIKK